jgi:hypothetical protein
MKGARIVLRSLPVLLAVVSLAGCSSLPESTQASDNKKDEKPGVLSSLLKSAKPVAVPTGTEIAVVLDQSISSEQSRSGDPFDASVAAPVVVDGKTVIPKGAHVQGIVVEARASGRLQGVARLRLALNSVEIAGKNYDLQTTSLTRSGQNHDKRNWTLIGGGTGVGTVIGAMAGGGKGAAIGAAVGAGAGTATAAATGKKDIVLPAESQLSFKLSQPVSIEVKG